MKRETIFNILIVVLVISWCIVLYNYTMKSQHERSLSNNSGIVRLSGQVLKKISGENTVQYEVGIMYSSESYLEDQVIKINASSQNTTLEVGKNYPLDVVYEPESGEYKMVGLSKSIMGPRNSPTANEFIAKVITKVNASDAKLAMYRVEVSDSRRGFVPKAAIIVLSAADSVKEDLKTNLKDGYEFEANYDGSTGYYNIIPGGFKVFEYRDLLLHATD